MRTQWLGGSKGLTFNFFANSNPPGSDANNGLTAATAKATLTAVAALNPSASQGLALITDSSWFDVFFPTNGIGLVGASGSGANPIIDGAKAIPNANFTLTPGASFTASITTNQLTVTGTPTGTLAIGQTVNGAGVTASTTITALGTGTGGTGTYTLSASMTVASEAMTTTGGNTYQASIACSTVSSVGTGSQGTYVLWENGGWLVRAASQAAMVAGTYFVAGGPSNMSTVTPNATLFVWPPGSTNPITNSKLYEFTFQFAGIDNFSHDGATYTGIVGRRAGAYFGSIQGGLNTNLARCLSAMCGRHNFVIGSGAMYDCIAFDCDDRSVYSDPGAMIVFFTNVGTGKSFTVNRSMAIMPTGRQAFSQRSGALLNHGSSATHDNATVNGFILVGVTGVNLSATNSVTANDVFSTACPNTIQMGVACPVVINRVLANNTVALNGGAIWLSAGGSTPGMPASVFDCAVYNAVATNSPPLFLEASLLYTLKNNTFVANNTNGACVGSASAVSAGSSFTNNICILGANAVNNRYVTTFSTAGWASFDYNVYINLGSGNTAGWSNNSVNYFTLADWQAATGFDTHSVLLNATQAAQLFLNGPSAIANGDFRINPACSLTFTDGTPIVGNAGPRQFYDWNARALVAGQPSRWPVPPATEAQCKTYIANPGAWSF